MAVCAHDYAEGGIEDVHETNGVYKLGEHSFFSFVHLYTYVFIYFKTEEDSDKDNVYRSFSHCRRSLDRWRS